MEAHCGLVAMPGDYRWYSANVGSKADVAGLKAHSTSGFSLTPKVDRMLQE
jgi:hypothetical protein